MHFKIKNHLLIMLFISHQMVKFLVHLDDDHFDGYHVDQLNSYIRIFESREVENQLVSIMNIFNNKIH